MSASPAYTKRQIILHWIVALLILFNYITGDFMADAMRAAVNAGEKLGPTPHVIAGIAIVLLVLWRMAIKAKRGAPGPLPGESAAMNKMAHLGHLALYGVVILTVVSGGLAWGAGIRAAGEAHETLTTVLMVLVAGHVVMALYHQFVKRDGVLMRMIHPK